MSQKLEKRLRKAGIRHYDLLIHDQPKKWLIKNFSRGADEYPVNVSLLMRNIAWQARERIIKGAKPPLNELIRTFWYIYIKPTLSRADSLAEEVDQYKQLVAQFVYMVKDIKAMRYSDIGFRDAFVDDLKFYGIKNTRMYDLINPDMLTPEETKLARHRIPTGKNMQTKNQTWLREVHKRNYKNQKYLEEQKRFGEKILYGLEAESIKALIIHKVT